MATTVTAFTKPRRRLPLPPYVTTTQTAEVLGLSRVTVRVLCHHGVLERGGYGPAVGGGIEGLVTRDSVETLMERIRNGEQVFAGLVDRHRWPRKQWYVPGAYNYYCRSDVHGEDLSTVPRAKTRIWVYDEHGAKWQAPYCDDCLPYARAWSRAMRDYARSQGII